MTVRELIQALEEVVRDYGEEYEDKEVVIAEYQNYGSDWAYNIDDIDAGTYLDFDKDNYDEDDSESNYDEDDSESNCVRIILGRQIGTMQDDLW